MASRLQRQQEQPIPGNLRRGRLPHAMCEGFGYVRERIRGLWLLLLLVRLPLLLLLLLLLLSATVLLLLRLLVLLYEGRSMARVQIKNNSRKASRRSAGHCGIRDVRVRAGTVPGISRSYGQYTLATAKQPIPEAV